MIAESAPLLLSLSKSFLAFTLSASDLRVHQTDSQLSAIASYETESRSLKIKMSVDFMDSVDSV